MDVLADVMETLRLSSSLYCRIYLREPWGLRLPAGDLAHFHVVERGACYLQLGAEEPPLRLAAGDLIVLPHGRGHVLADHPSTPSLPLRSIVQPHPPGALPLVRHGGAGAETALICGAFRFMRGDAGPLLGLLPPLLHISAGEVNDTPALRAALQLLAEEAREQ